MAISCEYLRVVQASAEKALKHVYAMNIGKANEELSALVHALESKIEKENQLELVLDASADTP